MVSMILTPPWPIALAELLYNTPMQVFNQVLNMVSMILTPPWPIALAELLSTTHSCLSIQPGTKHGEHDSHPALANRPRRVTLYNTFMSKYSTKY